VQDHTAKFPGTRWSLVAAAADADRAGNSRAALSTLCEMYWYPLYAFVRRRGFEPDEAQDLTQGFFARLLEKNYLREFQPERGRFRTFLLAAAGNFLSNEWDAARTLKRGGGTVPVPIDGAFETAESRYCKETGNRENPERLFERQWAATLLDLVLQRLAGEYSRGGKAGQFEFLKPFVMGDEGLPYAQIAAELHVSEGSIRIAVHRLRRRFREVLREEIAETVEDPRDVEPEIQFLMSAIR
jgi:RNA polymerase sigma factor (sigma-70 family)